MRKHLSLLLALLMVFSVFFATSAAAAQPEQNAEGQLQSFTNTVSVRKEGEAPRVTDQDSTGDAGINANTPISDGGGGGCSHTYKYLQYTASYHKKVCTKCGLTTYVSHTLKYTSQSATQHKKLCTVCGYSTVGSHNLKYQNCGNAHQKYCTLCPYTASEGHTYGSTYTSLTANLHSVACTKCGSTKSETHTFSYTDCGDVHNKHCAKCGYSANESHSYGAGECISATMHTQTCTCGHVIQTKHNWTGPAYYNSSYHKYSCSVCSAGLLEGHNYRIIQYPFWINQMGHPGIQECSGCKDRFVFG